MELAFEGAVALCQQIYENAVAASDNIQQCKDLAEHVLGIQNMLNDMLHDLKMARNQNFPQALFSAIDNLNEALEHADKVIDVYGKHGRILRYVLATKVQAEFNGAFERIDQALQRLSTVNVQLVTRVKSQLDELTFNMEAMSYRLSSQMEKITKKLNLLFDKNKNSSSPSEQIHFENQLMRAMSEIPDIDPQKIDQSDIDDLIKTKEIIRSEKEELDALMLEQIINVLQQQQGQNQGQNQSQNQQQNNKPEFNKQKSIEPPSQIVCPLTLQVMEDPVILYPTGQTYERSEIEHWFERGNHSDPLTGIQISGKPMLTTNYAVKQMIDDWNTKKIKSQNQSQKSEIISSSQEIDIQATNPQQQTYPPIKFVAASQQDVDETTVNLYDQGDFIPLNIDTPNDMQNKNKNIQKGTNKQANQIDFKIIDDSTSSSTYMSSLAHNQTGINSRNINLRRVINQRGIKSWPRWLWALIIFIIIVIIAVVASAVIISENSDSGSSSTSPEGDQNSQSSTNTQPQLVEPDPTLDSAPTKPTSAPTPNPPQGATPTPPQGPGPTPTPTPPQSPTPPPTPSPTASQNPTPTPSLRSSITCKDDPFGKEEYCQALPSTVTSMSRNKQIRDFARCLNLFRDETRCNNLRQNCEFGTNLSSPELLPEQCIPKNFSNIDNIVQYIWESEDDQEKYRNIINCISKKKDQCGD